MTSDQKNRRASQRKITVSMNMTLDGIMEGPLNDPENHHQLWTFPFRDDAFAQYELEELQTIDALLIGRNSYQGLSAVWPTLADHEQFGKYAKTMNSLTKYVASTTLAEPLDWNARLIEGDLVENVTQLKQQPGRDIMVVGSGKLVNSLMQFDLIDEYRLKIYPMVLGGGRRLFQDNIEKKALRLLETKTFNSGIAVLSYQRDRTLG